MDLTRQEYPAILPDIEPEYAVDVLNDRVSQINRIHANIADWLQERRKIEEQYAASLRRLSKRPSQVDDVTLGVFQTPWQRIVAGMESIAQSHETLAAKIQADVEGPLRHYASQSREMSSMGNISGNLAAIAKELASAQKKAQKLDARGSGRAEDAESKVDDARAQWDSQAPFVFEQLQSLDEARVNHLRDVLTQFQTHELDDVERQRSSIEANLAVLLNVETADEIKTFAIRAKQRRSGVPARQDSIAGTSRTGGIPPTPPPPRHTNSDRASSMSRDRASPAVEEPEKKSKLGGLKRLGTVINRRKSVMPPPPPPSSAAEKRKEKGRSIIPFRRQESSRSFQELEQNGQDLRPSQPRDGGRDSRAELETPPQTANSRSSVVPQTPPPTTNGIGNLNRELSGNDLRLQQPMTPQVIAASPPQTTPSTQSQAMPVDASSTTRSSTLSPESAYRPDPFASATTDVSSTDESARNIRIQDQPIQEDQTAAQEAMNSVATTLRMQAQNSGLNRVQGSVRGRRDVRNSAFIPASLDPSTTAEVPTTAPLSPSASTMQSSIYASTPATDITPQTTGMTSSTAPEGSITSSVQRSLGTGSPTPETSLPVSQIAPIKAPADTESVYSTATTSAIATHHTDMHSSGLNASIVETVNTWFDDTGLTRSFVLGEIALAYNNSLPSTTPETTMIRIQNYNQLEKCATNPIFLKGTHEASMPGTYDLTLKEVSKPQPSMAFKYQLAVNQESMSRYSPILMTQAWQIIEGQASVIFMYQLNPAFSAAMGAQVLALRNVTVTISVAQDGAKAISAQMMPVPNGQFKRRTGNVIWKLPELVLKPTQERMLVRFMTENNGLAKKGGVDIKFEMPNTLASAIGVERFAPGTGGLDAESAKLESSDPFADEEESHARRSAEDSSGGRWEDVMSRKVLVAGRYCIE